MPAPHELRTARSEVEGKEQHTPALVLTHVGVLVTARLCELAVTDSQHHMPERDGEDAHRARQETHPLRQPPARHLEDALFDAIKAGAAAFILKDVGPDDLVTIIRRVVTGEYLINDKVFAKPAVASRVLKEFRELAVYGQEAQPIFAPLSPREVEILDNIAQGMTNKQVAYALSISEQTVKNHMSSILRKLAVNDRTQAVVYAMRQGWIKMPED